MNLYFRNETAFYAEYQNQPRAPGERKDELAPGDILAKAINLKRGIVPANATYLSAFIDVQGKLLYWMVIAWEQDFTGHIVDYGSYPDQGRIYFSLADAKKTMQQVCSSANGMEGVIYAALEKLTDQLAGHEYKNESGSVHRLGRILIDANWGESTGTVYDFCRQSKHAAILTPSHGKFIGAGTTPFEHYPKRDGEIVGANWWFPSIKKKRAIRHVMIDTNFYKTFAYARLASVKGSRGTLTIFDDKHHQMLVDQILSEKRQSVTQKGRTVDEWKLPPNRPDNHLLDCLVGCAVGASIMGARLEKGGASIKQTEKKANKRRVFYAKGW